MRHNTLRIDGVKQEHLKDDDVATLARNTADRIVSLTTDFFTVADESIERELPILDLTSLTEEELQALREGGCKVMEFADLVSMAVTAEVADRSNTQLPLGNAPGFDDRNGKM